MAGSGKIIAAVVSILLVVGVVVGAVVVVNNNGTGNNGGELKTSNKAVSAVCQSADDQKLCHDVLTPVNSSNPKDYITQVVKFSTESVLKALNMSDRLMVESVANGTSDGGVKMALDDCKDLLQSAIHELEASGVFVNSQSLPEVFTNSAELKNWLGAVIAYQQSCLDGFDTDGEKHVQGQLQSESLDSVMKLTALALDVVAGVSKVLSELGLNLTNRPVRRLLGLDKYGFPSWLYPHDRKLINEASQGSIVPNAVVAKDGSGQYKTVLEAINAYPKKHQGRWVIYVKAGIYDEYITVDKAKRNIYMYGDGPAKTIITGRKNFAEGVKTMRTATFTTVAEGFIAKGIAFENTAGPGGHQAVALRVMGDRSAFFDCAFRGHQDTLYAHAHRQFYRNCEISGTIDFIFGYASTYIQNSKIIVRKPKANQQNIIVADGTDQKNMPSGVVLHNCQILAEPSLEAENGKVRTFLARPWKAFSRAVFIENTIGGFINKEGYIPWSPAAPNNEHAYFGEFGNIGAGADASGRVKWAKGLISKDEASQFTVDNFLQANSWLHDTGFPFDASFTKN
ncbi:hypothetical protein HN51_039410 [Arachis hypogaea]|uniref:Pectinesterase n=3 Tax=Arachis TaxID=3817 RepID=A0A444YJ33_ARAHY|nr:pectinesterase-like [Arachis hypogaea]QHN84935.1 putative pectinesterase/pectinesterase inhibitor [Arachis hypogaea]RYR01921.1 hypothetical protein Ahy_B06g080784 isoform A [Arachis hypogaea]